MNVFHIFLILAPSTQLLVWLIFHLRTIQGSKNLTCSSKPKNITYCPMVDTSVITRVQLLHNFGFSCYYSTIHPYDMKQMSKPVFGYRDNYVWVANGCNATFRVQYNVTCTRPSTTLVYTTMITTTSTKATRKTKLSRMRSNATGYVTTTATTIHTLSIFSETYMLNNVSTANIDAFSIKTTTTDQMTQQLSREHMFAVIVICILTFICATLSVVILWRRRQHRKCLKKTTTCELKLTSPQDVNNAADNSPKMRRIECLNGSAQDSEHDLQSAKVTVEMEDLDGNAYFILEPQKEGHMQGANIHEHETLTECQNIYYSDIKDEEVTQSETKNKYNTKNALSRTCIEDSNYDTLAGTRNCRNCEEFNYFSHTENRIARANVFDSNYSHINLNNSDYV